MSYQMRVDPLKRAAALFIGGVRDELLRALIDVKKSEGITQAEIAKQLGVHRSVVNRELSGHANLTLRRVAEIATALGYEPKFVLTNLREHPQAGANFVSSLGSERRSGEAATTSKGVVFQTAIGSTVRSTTKSSSANEL